MSIGAALLLIAAGAILKWAVTAHIHGFDLQTAGTVLFVIGLCALPLSILYTFWTPAARAPREDPTQAPPQY
jgi:hypothetical protein